MTSQEYVPGVCNIGRAETDRRWKIGWIALLATAVFWLVLIGLKIAPLWRLLVFFPASLSAAGFLQAAWRFCAKFGLMGTFNTGPGVGRTDIVEQAEFRRQDRRTARRIIGLSALIGTAVAAAAYMLPA